ncbi:MAG TPA: glycosyltransferase family 2 protein [Zeimonas sp.]
MSGAPGTICIVVPVHDEAAVLATSLPRIVDAVRSAAPQADVRLLAVDDGSEDGTAEVLDRLAARDTRITFAAFTRNFGKEAAIHAGLRLGLERTDADVFVVIDADLQHPPELVGPMLERWRAGYPVVEAVKRDRGEESLLRRSSANAFYRIFSRLSGIEMVGATDFKLLDRAVAAELVELAERTRFFRGMVRWLGHPAASIVFDVPAREGGRSAWSAGALTRYAWRNLTAFSSAPLELVSWFGAAGLVVGAVLAIKALFDKLSGQAMSGFSTVILLQVIFGSLILLSLGIIGSYVARIYDEIKRRPHYVLRSLRDERAPGRRDTPTGEQR